MIYLICKTNNAEIRRNKKKIILKLCIAINLILIPIDLLRFGLIHAKNVSNNNKEFFEKKI